jgi:hypothetical protein
MFPGRTRSNAALMIGDSLGGDGVERAGLYSARARLRRERPESRDLAPCRS